MIATWLGEWSAAYAASPGYAPGDQVAHLSTSWACNVLGTQQEPGIGADWSHLDDLPVVGSPGQAGPPPPPPRPSTANLLTGDSVDFEGGTLGEWTRTFNANGTFEASTEQAHSGSHSMKITAAGTGQPTQGNTYGGFPLALGVSYQAGLWVYSPVGQLPLVVTLSVEWVHGQGAWLGEDNFFGNWGQNVDPANTVPGEWAYLTGVWYGTVNPRATRQDHWFQVSMPDGSNPAAGDVCFVDDITIQALAP